MARSPVKVVMDTDPLKLKRYDTIYYKSVYSICVLIPILIALSLCFFLMFFMSPRSRTMRAYQRHIFEWNKFNYAEKLG